MDAARQIAVDLEQFEIRLGTERVRLLPVAGDVFCLNDARGPLVRALKFDERARLLTEVADRDVVSLVADAALVSSGVSSDDVRIAASLALAGGAEEAPPFPDCVQFVEQRYGWDEKRIAETMAIVIDRLCSQMVQQDSNGWKQIVFQKSDADLGSLISQMASKLSQRAVASDRRADAKPKTVQTQTSSTTSHQQSHSTKSAGFETQSSSPVKRVPFRVLGVNADRPTVEPVELVPAPARSQSVALSSSIAAASLKTDFPPPLKPQSNHFNFSLSQAAAAPAQIEQPLPQPVAGFPSWQPMATSVSNARASSEASSEALSERARMSSPASSVAAPETQSSQDWLAEVAQLLEAECDMRGIDP